MDETTATAPEEQVDLGVHEPTAHADVVREKGQADRPANAGRKLVERIADEDTKLDDVTEEEQVDAAAYLLSAFAGDVPEEDFVDHLRVNLGTPRKPKWVKWDISPLPGPFIRKVMESVASARSARRQQPGDSNVQFNANVRMVVEGTVYPDIKALAGSTGLADPGAFLEVALERKQGIIEQIAAEIYGLSGYDQGDLQDAAEVAAAGNS